MITSQRRYHSRLTPHWPKYADDSPLWPVVRESARRMVRLEQIKIEAEMKYLEQIRKLSDHIAEKIPQRTTFPIHDV